MRCPIACKSPSPAQAHCPTCHRTFGGVTGFDAHRKNGTCADPSTLGLVERDGVWRRPMTDVARERFASAVAVRDPACCRCDQAACAADDMGDHCVTRGCAWCLEGCPAPVGVPCCREVAS